MSSTARPTACAAPPPDSSIAKPIAMPTTDVTAPATNHLICSRTTASEHRWRWIRPASDTSGNASESTSLRYTTQLDAPPASGPPVLDGDRATGTNAGS